MDQSAVSEPLVFLQLIEDLEPRPAPVQMAIDEALLRSITKPLLRVYRWREPCVTIGYFEPLQPTTESFPDLPITRRWTGGGTVHHGDDWPYSLLIPSSDPFAHENNPRDSYRKIHAALARCLFHLSPPVLLATWDASKVSSACFENPVQHDLIQDGRKIAGAGQKRTRWGFLHQGSVQLEPSQHPQAKALVQALAQRFETIAMPASSMEQALQLSNSRYSTLIWTARR